MGATMCALLSGSISLSVALIWISHAADLAAFWPPLLEMKINTAAGFLACAIALLLFVCGQSRVAILFAVVPFVFGAVTLWEHLSGSHASIDELLLDDWSGNGVPGRPAPNTATALTLLGGTFFALGLMRGGGRQDLIVKLLCFVMIAIAAEAIAGHIVGSRYAIGWGTTQSMSSLAAGCVILLALGIFAHCTRAEMQLFNQPSLWLPGLLGFGILLLDLATTREYQVGFCYILLVACGVWFSRRYFLTIFTVLSLGLALFGYLATRHDAILSPAETVNLCLTIGAIVLVAVLVRQHLRSQESRRHMVEHLASVQELTDTGSFELDLATMSFTATRGFDTIHGLRALEVRDWARFVETMIPLDDHAAVGDFMTAVRRGECDRTLDYSFLRADGITGEAALRCVPTLDARGLPTRITGIVHDITRQRQREQEQADLEAKLRHTQKLESLGLMAGGVAHDLNNILVPVTMLAPLLLDTVEDPADRQSLQLIIGSARRAKDLVREMLVFTRKDPPAFESVWLDQLVRESLTILRAGIPSEIQIVEELAPVPAIVGSKGQLYQVILNLAINAAQAIGARPGTITIGTGHVLADDAHAGSVRLFVHDDGDGMDPATLARVFEPFFSTKEDTHGTGIGLSIVYGIVKKHNGLISAQSSRGHGACFDLTFPTAPVGERVCLAA